MLHASNLIEDASILPDNPVFNTVVVNNIKGPANRAYLATFEEGLRVTAQAGVQTDFIKNTGGISILSSVNM